MKASMIAICMIIAAAIYANALPPLEEIENEYNPYKVVTVKCMINEVGKVYQVWGPIKGKTNGMHLKVQTGTETITVFLGPAWYIEKQHFTINQDDVIQVKGCKKMYEGETFIVAEEIKKGDVVLKLRDESGIPYWAGGMKKASN